MMSSSFCIDRRLHGSNASSKVILNRWWKVFGNQLPIFLKQRRQPLLRIYYCEIKKKTCHSFDLFGKIFKAIEIKRKMLIGNKIIIYSIDIDRINRF